MKQKSVFLGVLMSILVMPLFNGCKADVDLKDIDTTIGADMALALPIGHLTTEIGDFLGSEMISPYIHVTEDGVLNYRDTFSIKRKYHNFDASEFTAHEDGFHLLNPYGFAYTLPQDMVFPVQIPITITVGGVNVESNQDYRVDSVGVYTSYFDCDFDITGITGFAFSDIVSVKLVMDENFSRAKGREVEMDLAGKDFNQTITTLIDDFTLNFMKDRNGTPSLGNVINTIHFDLELEVAFRAGMVLNPDAAIRYRYGFVVEDYQAAWGWFTPGVEMCDSATFVLGNEWEGWNNIKDLEVKLASPTIQLNTYHSISAPLKVYGGYLYVASSQQKEHAKFNGKTEWNWPLNNFVGLQDPIEAFALNTYTFSNSPDSGAIDKLFEVRPDTIGYKFNVALNTDYRDANGNEVLQYRLSKNADITAEAIVNVPLHFNDSMKLSYTDTIDSISISLVDIDSLITEVEMLKEVTINDLKLILLVENTIPFNVIADLTFLNENDSVLDINLFGDSDVLHIDCPTAISADGIVTEPTRQEIIINIDQERYNTIVDLKKIIFQATLGENSVPVKVLDRSGLRIGIAVAADVSAVAELDGLFNE